MEMGMNIILRLIICATGLLLLRVLNSRQWLVADFFPLSRTHVS